MQSDRTGISGGSYGGYASMWAASALTEHFAAAVAFVGISNQLSKCDTGDIPREMYRHVKLLTDTPVRYDFAIRFERWMRSKSENG